MTRRGHTKEGRKEGFVGIKSDEVEKIQKYIVRNRIRQSNYGGNDGK